MADTTRDDGGAAAAEPCEFGLARRALRYAPVEALVEAFDRGFGRRSRLAGAAGERLVRAHEARAADAAVRALVPPREASWAVQAARLLAVLRDGRAVPLLVAWLDETTGSPAWNAEVIRALGAFRTPEAEAALVRAAATWAAQAHATSHYMPSAGEALARSLARVGTPAAVDALLGLTAAMRKPWDETTLRMVARVVDGRFVPFLVEMLAGPHRAAALAGLERVATERAIPALKAILHTGGDRPACYAAGRALAVAGRAEGTSALRYYWPSGTDNIESRRAAAWGLGRLPADWVTLGTLIELLRDDDPGVRARAAKSLGRVRADELPPGHAKRLHDAASAIAAALVADPCHRVRANAATALGGLPAAATTARALVAAADTDPVTCVREAAAAARRRRGGR